METARPLTWKRANLFLSPLISSSNVFFFFVALTQAVQNLHEGSEALVELGVVVVVEFRRGHARQVVATVVRHRMEDQTGGPEPKDTQVSFSQTRTLQISHVPNFFLKNENKTFPAV